MKILSFSDYSRLSRETAGMISDVVQNKPEALLCFPAGATSIGTFNALIEMNKSGEVDFRNCSMVGLDEWVGLGSETSENCFHFLKKHLLDPLEIKPEQLCFFNGESSDLDGECKKVDRYIKSKGGIDLMLLGIGMNGHLGLNEPGVSFDHYAHIVKLDQVTRAIGQKYFSGPIDLTRGITLGMNHIRESKKVILQISGASKVQLFQRFLESEVSEKFPASFLKTLSQAMICIDEDAKGAY